MKNEKLQIVKNQEITTDVIISGVEARAMDGVQTPLSDKRKNSMIIFDRIA